MSFFRFTASRKKCRANWLTLTFFFLSHARELKQHADRQKSLAARCDAAARAPKLGGKIDSLDLQPLLTQKRKFRMTTVYLRQA